MNTVVTYARSERGWSIALGILFHWPSSSLWVVGTLVGVSMLFSGIARITVPVRLQEI